MLHHTLRGSQEHNQQNGGDQKLKCSATRDSTWEHARGGSYTGTPKIPKDSHHMKHTATDILCLLGGSRLLHMTKHYSLDVNRQTDLFNHALSYLQKRTQHYHDETYHRSASRQTCMGQSFFLSWKTRLCHEETHTPATKILAIWW